MKNAISALLIFCMILSSSACSKTTKTTDASSKTDPSKEEAVTEDIAANSDPTDKGAISDLLPIDSKNFPDPILLNYVSENIDTDSDDFLSKEERESVKAIEINSTLQLDSLVGIEHFPNITELYCLGGNLTSLDVSKNHALELLDCSQNRISDLDVSGCTNLKRVTGYGNRFHTLNVSGCSSLESLNLDMNFDDTIETLTGFSDCTNLKDLSLGKIDAQLLNISSFPKLERLCCVVDDLSELDLMSNPALKELRVEGIPGPIDLSQNPELETLVIRPAKVGDVDLQTSLDLSHNSKLSYLEIGEINLCSIDLSNNPKLESIEIRSNHMLSELDLSSCKNLKYLECIDNGLTSINIRNCPSLETLVCADNALSELDISGNPNLGKLICRNNRLTSLHTGSCPLLYSLDICDNNLTSLDLSKNRALQTLTIYHNNISELNVQNVEAFYALKDTDPNYNNGVCSYYHAEYYNDNFENFDAAIYLECDSTTKVIF